MHKPAKTLIILTLLLGCWPLLSQARVESRDERDAITPNVTIMHAEDKELQVHEVNGRIYGIKVIPKRGTPYFLVDAEGDGNFVRAPAERMLVPEWVLIRW